jgi:hypothetical protein
MSEDVIVYHRNPKGNRLPALEQNILKYRAFEMAIVLFYIEDLKAFVLDSIRATDRICSGRDDKKPRIPADATKVYEKAWAVLVADGIISQEDSDEIQCLINYRNHIAHGIHELTCDISREPFARVQFNKVRYDYEAVTKLKRFRDKITRGSQARYVMSLSLRSMLFDATEKTYQQELKRLDRKIRRQIEVRKEQIERLEAELSGTNGRSWQEDTPAHPGNIARNGTLTPSGVETCFRLFDQKFSPLAVAHLMGISHRAALRRRQAWESRWAMMRANPAVNRTAKSRADR